jgi:two-component system, OmpR family, sensor histidine kinase TorS
LFDAFSQTDSGRNKMGGTGLGLAISKSIMLAMNGDIGVHSEEGEGSQFWFSVPLEVGEKIETKVTVVETCIRAKVLLIEDNPVNCIVAEGFLHNLGHEVVIATTGKEARTIFAAQAFDIALVDINLPDCDGVELIQQLKDIVVVSSDVPEQYTPPMVAVSAHVFNEEVEGYLASGFDGFLPKPLEKEALSQLIVTQLDGKALLLPQPGPDDAICKGVNKTNRLHKASEQCQGNDLYSSQMASVVSDSASGMNSRKPDEGEMTVTLIDSKVIEGDLSILGLEKMKQIVGLFEDSSQQTLHELIQAGDANNGREVKSLAHKLKGSAGSLGLSALLNLCHSIEASDDPLQEYRDCRESLTQLTRDSLEALKQHVL